MKYCLYLVLLLLFSCHGSDENYTDLNVILNPSHMSLKPVLEYMDSKAIYFYNPFDPRSTPEPEGAAKRNRL
jgi:hypothetical protein